MYERLLGPAFHSLPNAIRALHRSPGTRRFSGACTIQRGDSWLSRLLGRAASLPPAGTTAVTVTIESNGVREIWLRQFGAHRMRSVLHTKHNRLRESLGLADFVFALAIENRRIRWTLEAVRAFGVSLPKRWFDLDVWEGESDGRYHFNVRVDIRGLGLLVHYAGWLE